MGHWCKPENGMPVEIFAFKMENSSLNPSYCYRFDVYGMNIVGSWIKLMEDISLKNVDVVHNFLENDIYKKQGITYFKDLRTKEGY